MIENVLISLAIAAALIIAGFTGYRRGFIAVLAGVVSIMAGAIVAAALYRPLGRLMIDSFKAMPSLANVGAYVGLFAVTEFGVLILMKRVVQMFLRQWNGAKWNHWGGTALGVVQMIVIIAIVLAVIVNLPLGSNHRQALKQSLAAQPLLSLGAKMQNIINTAPGGDLTETVTLLTVESENNKTISLDFTVTDGEVNEKAEQELLILVNKERQQRGLAELRVNEKARQVARKHSQDMFAHGYFSHINQDGLTPFDRMKKGNVSFRAAGENLALAPTVAQAHEGLMNSPGHRANILSPEYHTVGIGVIDGGDYGLMVTQNFTN